MLTQMRKLAKSWVSSVFLGALALAFGFWGIGDIFQGRTSTDVASVDGRAISLDDFQRDYRGEIRQRSAQGAEFTPDMARAIGLGKQVLDRSLIRAALDNIVDSLKLTVSDALVSTQIRNMQAFKGPLGTFDKMTFLRAINDTGFTEQGFINAIRADSSRDQLLRAMQGAFQMPAGYVAAIYAYQEEVRAADYIDVPASVITTVAPPTDAQLTAYVKAHAASFSTPEYREITYAAINPDDVMGKIPAVTDAQIKQQYDAQKDTYNIAEKRDLEQITFPSEAEAKAARAKIDSGISYADIAKARGLKPTEVELGTLAKTDLDSTRAAAAFALPENSVSPPVKGPFGWVLMRVAKITPAVNKSLDEVKNQIKADLQKRLAGSKLVDVANAYQEAVDGGDPLAVAAKKAGMRVVHLASLDSKGLIVDGSKANVPNDPDFLPQAFKAEVGEDGEPFQTRAGNYFAIKADGVSPPKIKPLNAVRVQATEEWIVRQRQKQLEAKAKAIADQVTRDQSFVTAAKNAGGMVQKSPGLQRNMASDVFSPALMKDLFARPPGVAVYGPAAKGDSYIVAVTTGVLHPPLPTDNPQFEMGVQRISGEMGSDLTLSFAAAAQKKQGVTIHQDRITQVTGEGS